MYIENVTLKSVPADSLVLPVEEGTILTKNGTIPADLSQAYGIVPEKITSIPPTQMIYLAVAGTIDLKLNNVSFTEEEMQALGKDFNFVPGDEGGGNPNRVETINGTLSNPFTDMEESEIQELFSAVYSNNATVYLLMDPSAVGFPATQCGGYFNDDHLFFVSCSSGFNSGEAVTVSYTTAPNIGAAYLLSISSGTGTITDVKDYASVIPTTLTIIWHPLPDQS